MRKVIWVTMFSLLVILAGCTSTEVDPDSTSTSEPAGVDAQSTAPALATVPPQPAETPLPEDYPAPTPFPTSVGIEGYPGIPTLPPKYPAGDSDVRVWMLRPLGIQCSDANSYEFATIEEAVDALEAAGVEVFEAEMVSLPVTESCDSPTSEHFRVLIIAQGLDTALGLEWYPEP